MRLSAWGNYPAAAAQEVSPGDSAAVLACITRPTRRTSLITRGLGRRYGDSALAVTPGNGHGQVLSTLKFTECPLYSVRKCS